MFYDSVGIGYYRIDLHPTRPAQLHRHSWPFQIPLGALIPERVENLLPANKNLGVTHITNGCYRLHPVEWNIGEAAGALAAQALNLQQSAPQTHPQHAPDAAGRLSGAARPDRWASNCSGPKSSA